MKTGTTSISVWDTGTGTWKASVTDTVASPDGFVVVTGQAMSSEPRMALVKLVVTIAGRVPCRLRDVVREALRIFPG